MILLLISILMMTACGQAKTANPTGAPAFQPLPQGELKGILNYADGTPAKGAQVLPGVFSNDVNNSCSMGETSLASTTLADDTGVFHFSSVKAGYYCLLVLDMNTGNIAAVLNNKQQVFSFEITENAGVNLGKVTLQADLTPAK